MLRTIALQAVQQKYSQAVDWLLEIDSNTTDEAVRQTQLQVALAQQQWELLAKFIRRWATTDQNTSQAQYWLGRALEQTEQLETAKQLYQQAAQDRGFYGFLAADRLKQPYQFNVQAISVSEKEKDTLLKNPAIIRAREFFLVGLTDEARQEWQGTVENLSSEQLESAAQLASEWNWYYQAIVTASRANAFDDVKLRFPTPFYDMVLGQAQEKNLDSAWVYAVIRQESAFRVDARSRANALGLMQLLPATAKELANKEQITLDGEKDIFVPETNIRLGVLYLRQMLDRFDDNYVLASASYNAGASRVRSWVKTQGCLPMDAWIELIPFKETRKYVQAILSYTPIFEYRLTGNTKVQSMHVDELDNEACQGSV
ncbi:MAG: transglycosylase SLT domain-containing protein [Thiotrichaceae bacterium]